MRSEPDHAKRADDTDDAALKASAEQEAQFHNLMAISPELLDEIADLFGKSRPDEAREALLRVLELQTQQNIAYYLSQSEALIVLSADEIGLAGNQVMREKLRDYLKSMPWTDASPVAKGAASQPPPKTPPPPGGENDARTIDDDE